MWKVTPVKSKKYIVAMLVGVAMMNGTSRADVPVAWWELYNYTHCQGIICRDPRKDNREEWCYQDGIKPHAVLHCGPKGHPWSALTCHAPGVTTTKCGRKSEF
jgi:hypothetical protein